ncbi:Electroneutral sodium bicarbonate exchanger 1 [Camelus dromedarius]|uniref:Electroneutral sodium bicarbonate exchanger 1 n=1 Tax=Camelus dromedarius TaxID=9838 RepID=A0A5N4DEJ6_CAMDR|nr:Electroneutral sodium bicarbonate exchanger 1 [Camelus dromedarius]
MCIIFVCLTFTVLSLDFRCDPSEINISDEMPKTTVWKALSMNSGNTKEKSSSLHNSASTLDDERAKGDIGVA